MKRLMRLCAVSLCEEMERWSEGRKKKMMEVLVVATVKLTVKDYKSNKRRRQMKNNKNENKEEKNSNEL